MHVEQLLQDEDLGLRLLWAEDPLLRREISGLTATDLEDPMRFLQPGEIVLSGLVWWSADGGRQKAEQFVSSLSGAGTAALLAGEETHGAVPDDIVVACMNHEIPLIAVPAEVSFRTITDAFYLRQWGQLSRRPAAHHALPTAVRTQLQRLLTAGAGPEELLNAASTRLGPAACSVLTATGRIVARTPGTPVLEPRQAAEHIRGGVGVTLAIEGEASPYDRWYLNVMDAADVPPRVLHELAGVLAECRERAHENPADERSAELGQLLGAPAADPVAVAELLRSCGLPDEGPFHVVAAGTSTGDAGRAAAVLVEALAHQGAAHVVTELNDGAAALVSGPSPRSTLESVWPLLHACDPTTLLHAGVSSQVAAPDGLEGAVREARYGLDSARGAAPDRSEVTDTGSFTTLARLLTGLPREVRRAFSARVLGPLATEDGASAAMLRETLETFLAHNGSWARTGESLHLHVNTVHYRVQRIEVLTGLDLSRLDHRLDLRAALLCR
ncbi:PucR family transcriptional regulator [Streptomyces sp. WAC07061]|uniref:PucR family transcriptional regulator n=1 Tax=Streptomyces sp. WAC07061 TaxID=2487410 RepID=UPI000F7B1819|nr:PucR family transcriptional regulator [Streptomyces sp. WAC07061]RSS61319.1 PucR family transcriptional regulator [Streptomyces sp. WAC07061]